MTFGSLGSGVQGASMTFVDLEAVRRIREANPTLSAAAAHTLALRQRQNEQRLDEMEDLSELRRELELERQRVAAERRALEIEAARRAVTASAALERPTSIKSRLEPFKSGDFEVWIRSFANEAEDHGWARDPAPYLRKSLDGVAKEFLNSLPEEVKHIIRAWWPLCAVGSATRIAT